MNELILLPCSVRGGAGRGNSSVDGVTRVRRQLAKYIIRKLGAGKMNAFLARVFRSTICPFSITFAGKFYSFEGKGGGEATWAVKAFAFAWLFFESGDASIRWVDLFIISSFFLFHFSFSKLFSFLFADAFSWIFSPFPPFRYSVRRVRISRWMREGLNVFVFLVLLRRDTMLITQSLFMEV